MKDGFYNIVKSELQGQLNTYYVGGLMGFELTERNSTYAMALVCKHFANDNLQPDFPGLMEPFEQFCGIHEQGQELDIFSGKKKTSKLGETLSSLPDVVEKEHKRLLAHKSIIEKHKEEQERHLLEMFFEPFEQFCGIHGTVDLVPRESNMLGQNSPNRNNQVLRYLVELARGSDNVVTGWPVDLQAYLQACYHLSFKLHNAPLQYQAQSILLRALLALVLLKSPIFLLYEVVRLLVGTLKSVGTYDITIPDVERILKAKTVAAPSPMAPGGIYTSSQESQNQLVVAT
ncbi:hypothetical protein POM88_049686 [Heracleum sosnowskyi]|uniref:Uncharacterized protein n=1 Tax=Heracleum sosnowskyi TaxID=360622 RepID=A0AAD8LZP8_9APIA|nr:hypothetical protein POM88_049686 [Heracleum sosnowskyi]